MTTRTWAATISRRRSAAGPGRSATGRTAAWNSSAASSTIAASTASLEGMWE